VSIDVSTLIGYSASIFGMIAVLLLIFWVREGYPAKFLWFTLPFLLGCAGGFLLLKPSIFPGLWGYRMAAGLILLAYGFAWQAVRAVYGRSPRVVYIILPVTLWVGLSALVFSPYELYNLGAGTRASLVCLFNGLAAWEFWRSREEDLPSRSMLFWIFAVFACFAFIRIPLADLIPAPYGAAPAEPWTVVGFNILAVGQALLVCAFMIALTRERTSLQNYHMALMDPLTGVQNRRGFSSYVAALKTSPEDERASWALLLVDLDHFKQINDLFGHGVGDRVITMAAQTAEEVLRRDDLVFRFGGEEFVCLLRSATAKDAMIVAERLRMAFQLKARRVGDHVVNATVSIGVAAAREGSLDVEAMLLEADRALYDAKRSGRNQTLLAALPKSAAP